LDWSHGDYLGDVVALGEDQLGRLWACAEVDARHALPRQELFFSPSIEGHRDGAYFDDIELRGLALTAVPGSLSLPPVAVLEDGDDVTRLPVFARELLEAGRSYRRGAPLELCGRASWRPDPPPTVRGTPSRSRRVPSPARGVPSAGRRVVNVDGQLLPVEHSAPVGKVLAVH
jgi:hypothetical protein